MVPELPSTPPALSSSKQNRDDPRRMPTSPGLLGCVEGSRTVQLRAPPVIPLSYDNGRVGDYLLTRRESNIDRLRHVHKATTRGDHR